MMWGEGEKEGEDNGGQKRVGRKEEEKKKGRGKE